MKQNTNLERIIAKIDNDFNIDNSDWIPRVGAWAIDAMSMLNCLRTEIKRISLPVEGNIVYGANDIFNCTFKVYDKNGCEIKSAKGNLNRCCSFKGELQQTDTTDTTDFVINPNAREGVTQAITINDTKGDRYNYVEFTNKHICKNYVKIDNNKLELNFNTDLVIVEYTAIATYKSEVYDCELPVIPNNGLLIEAIAYYCLYKLLCRGYKHPVLNLHASQYGTNPYYIWLDLKDKAKRSVIIDKQGNLFDDGGIWRSSFFISTFNPKQ